MNLRFLGYVEYIYEVSVPYGLSASAFKSMDGHIWPVRGGRLDMNHQVNASVADGHGSVSPGSQQATTGATVSININPDPGYSVASITDNGAIKTIANPYTIFNIGEDHTVLVAFSANMYMVNAGVSSGQGSVNPATQSVAEGGAASIYITPDAGHHITGITDNGIPASVANPYVINNVTANHTVSVDFIINQYVVTPVAGPNGSIDPTTPQAINYNETASFAIIPDTGYHIESVTGCEGLLSGNTYTTGLIAGDCTVTATFAAGQYSVTAQMTGSGMGTISATGLSCGGQLCSGYYNSGESVTLTAVPAQGSRFTSWAGCDSSSGAECTVQVSADRSVVAAFTHIESLSLYDDFNGTSIDLTKWQGEDVAREVTNGQLRMKARSYYNSTQPVHIDLSLANPDSIQTIESKVTLGTYQNTQQSNTMVALFGRFFNDGTGAGVPGSNLGDIMAFVSIGGTSETPSFSWSVSRFTDPTNGNLVQTIDMGTFTTVPVVGTPSTLSISWDGATFTFTADGEIRTTSPALSVYPANMPQRGFFVRQSNNTGKEAIAEAFFDDVKVNGADYDDFAGTLVDQTKWVTYEHVREVTGGALRMRNRTAPNSLQSVITNSLNFAYPTEINVMQTTVTPTSFSNPSGATNKARIGGRFFNDGTGTPGNHLGEYVVDVFIGGTGTNSCWIMECYQAHKCNKY